jgi:predicted DNA-binding protein (MmcQ/YjbR family)
MDLDWIRQYCLSFPSATENVQWGDDLVFKVGGKMFAVTGLDSVTHGLSLKCTHHDFAELTEKPGIKPARYLARAQWISLESVNVLPLQEVKRLLQQSYELVLARMSKKQREVLMKAGRPKGRRRKKTER